MKVEQDLTDRQTHSYTHTDTLTETNTDTVTQSHTHTHRHTHALLFRRVPPRFIGPNNREVDDHDKS